MNKLWRQTTEGLEINIYAQPGAKKTESSGLHDGRLKVRVQAPPVDGKANNELIVYLAKAFDVSKSQVQLVRGETSRMKCFLITNISGPPDWLINIE